MEPPAHNRRPGSDKLSLASALRPQCRSLLAWVSFTVLTGCGAVTPTTPLADSKGPAACLSGQLSEPGSACRNSVIAPLPEQAQPKNHIGEAGREPWSEDEWQFRVAPYAWLPSIKTRANGNEFTVHERDLLDHVRLAGMATAEMRYQRWGLFADGLFFDVRARKDAGPLSLSVHLKQGMYQLGGFYRFGNEQTYLDAMGSVRYFSVPGTFRTNGVTVFRFRKDWFEPVVGAKFVRRLGRGWAVTARSDVGGFGLGDASDVTWQVAGLLSYRLSHMVSVTAGYRYYMTDYDDGSLDLSQRSRGALVGVQVDF